MIIATSPQKFSSLFNTQVPSYREVTAQDILDMTNCGLICRYGFYLRDDLQTVRAILRYEELRLEREQNAGTIRTCKRCGESLPDAGGRRGRPREFCDKCEPIRVRERFRKWHKKNRSIIT